MYRKLFNAFTIAAMLCSFLAVVPAGAHPPAPDDVVIPPDNAVDTSFGDSRYQFKPIDQPNLKDYLRLRERQRLLEAGLTAQASALDQTGTDRVLVLLVEFTGTDVFTWTAGVSEWDPLGIADPDEYTGTVGDCSEIQTKIESSLGYTLTQGDVVTFTYGGPAHNEIPRPVSMDDRSADSIWTEDFDKDWFDSFMFGDGVVFDYDMQDGTPISEDFTGQSVADYFSDLSDGAYTVTGDIVGWIPVPHSTWYYDADQCPGGRSGASVSRGVIPGAGTSKDLVKYALDYVNTISDTINGGFDWANYDQDGDGVIDRLWIVHSGYGEEDSSTLLNRTDYGEAAVWSHSSSVSPEYEVSDDISAGPYIIMPENGGIGVFAHEYGHNLGADDLYSYGNGETSAGFWTLMADDWTGYPIGFEPPAPDPWHLDNWGWLDPYVITDTSQVYDVKLGQASEFPGGDGVYRGVKIKLDDGVLPLGTEVWDGSYYWWSGKQDLANAKMTSAEAIDLPSGSTASLTFDMAYDIEDEWDFLWIQVSDDSGSTWNTITNTLTQCEHDPSWIGGLYNFPEDLCGAGLGGFYGQNDEWPDAGEQTFDLSDYLGESVMLRFWFMTDWGTTYNGAFVDNVAVTVDSSTVFSDDAESGDDNWTYLAPWQRSSGTLSHTHNLYLQWRNTNSNGGYDSALGDTRWRFGPANTGLLVWYNNNFYSDNEILSYLEDDYGFGPKGRMLVVDSHPDPLRDPNATPSWLGKEHMNIYSRGLMGDAPLTLADTNSLTFSSPYVISETTYASLPAVSSFHDSMGYYPGVADEGDGTYWCTVDWDASAAVPATDSYSVAGGSAYPGFNIMYVGGGWYGFWEAGTGGTGNPGDNNVQYGWHVKLLQEASDHTWAKVRVWNSMKEFDDTFAPEKGLAVKGEEITYSYTAENIGGKVDGFIAIPLDANKVSYVAGSAYGGVTPLPSGLSPQQLAAIYAEGGQAALDELAASQADVVGTLVWTGEVGTRGLIDFGFDVEIVDEDVDVTLSASIYDDASLFQTTTTDTLIKWTNILYMPLVHK